MKWCSVFLALQLAVIIAECANIRRVCYYASWSKWRPGVGKFDISNIDPFLCTHIIFAFASFDKTTSSLTTSTEERAMYAELNMLKKKNSQLQTLLAVGGWNIGSEPFSRLARDYTKRSAFVAAVVAEVHKNGFDGLDIDWEYPQSAQDKLNYVTLMKDLHSAFKVKQVESRRPSKFLLANAVPVTQHTLQFYDVPGLSQYVDFFNVMTYDYHGSWEKHTGLNSPLYKRNTDTWGQDTFNTHWAMQYWVKLGAPKEKINLGIATYGRSWTLNSPQVNGIGAAASRPGKVQKYSREAGSLSYYEVCIKLPSSTRTFDAEARVPYFVDGTFWASYDDPQSVTEKAQYVKSNNIGGMMFWTIDYDDFNNQCGQGKYPLLCSAKNVLEGISGSCSAVKSAVTAGERTGQTSKMKPGSGRSPLKKDIGMDSSGKNSGTDSSGASRPNTDVTNGDSAGCTDGIHRLETDCSGFYQCMGGTKFRTQYCPNGLLFNDKINNCDWPLNVIC